ncbi:thioesterase [Devosia geojensis]|uniref:Thioesterase n=1 Tax=Devosia geojensis TaxID=443610 RepID=A0A0F5FRW7_9HYPH|nr:acyl-CoA thioester hydrolase/BAAT C-terminal domain-containing protein [Devosia geojensis]KKB10927.1 thioesterase [Devosia geojensis]
MTLKIVRRLLPKWGTTYGPVGEGPFAAILVLHGSEGGWSGWSHQFATLLAAHGFLAFPFSYSRDGNAWNAGSIRDVPLDRTVQVLKALRAFEYAGPKVGILGFSRGAEHALLVATLMAAERMDGQPDAIAAHAAPDVVCGAFDSRRWRDKGDPGWQSWDAAERAWTWRGSSEELKPTTQIAVERITAPIFLSHGIADDVWSVEMTRRLQARLLAAGRAPQVHYFEGQRHMFDSAGQNDLNERLIGFFGEELG